MSTPSAATSAKWGDVTEDTPVETLAADKKPAATIEKVTEQLAEVKVESQEKKETKETKEEEDDEEALKLTAFSGLHPNDEKAEVTVTGPVDEDGKTSELLSVFSAAKSFEDLNLKPELLKGVYEMKFSKPSSIQAQALPIILDAKHPNLIGQAQAGSGKTGAFSLGILSRIDLNKKKPQALVLVPVRELAIQVASVIRQFGKFLPGLEVLEAVRQSKKEKVTAHVVVGTPGTVDNKIHHRDLDVRDIMVFVADEADQMINSEGLGDKTITIKRKMPKNCQILLFSATFDEQIRKFARTVATKAMEIMVKTEQLSLDNIKQYYIDCKSADDKYETLTDIFPILQKGQSIIFVHTVATAKDLCNRMRAGGYTVSLLHGKMQETDRDTVMNDFRTGKTNVLITTNVLARGIDVLAVTLVINYDIPLNRRNKADPETYLHRIGRTGRFGRKGVAVNFVHDDHSRGELAAIARHFNKNVVALPRDDIEKVEEIVAKDLK